MKDKDWERWNASMKMCSLEKNGTWVVVPKLKNVKIIGSKWVYTKKEGISGLSFTRLFHHNHQSSIILLSSHQHKSDLDLDNISKGLTPETLYNLKRVHRRVLTLA